MPSGPLPPPPPPPPQVFISECVGVSNVGFVLIVLGFFSATTSFVYGKIVKYVPRVILTTIAAVVNLFFLLFLQFWPRQPSFALIFLFAIGWGIADGVWNTMSASECVAQTLSTDNFITVCRLRGIVNTDQFNQKTAYL